MNLAFDSLACAVFVIMADFSLVLLRVSLPGDAERGAGDPARPRPTPAPPVVPTAHLVSDAGIMRARAVRASRAGILQLMRERARSADSSGNYPTDSVVPEREVE